MSCPALLAGEPASAGAESATLPSLGAESTEWVTRPCQDATLSFVRPGMVAKVLVKEGDPVTEGQLLVQQDDAAELAEMEQAKLTADSTVNVQAAEKNLEQSQLDLKKTEGAGKRGAATDLEVEHARLDVEIKRLSLDYARLQHELDIKKYDGIKAQVERMRILSPLNGRVEKLLLQQGESVENPQAKVIRVVQVDKLWVDAPVPLSQALHLAAGQPADVKFPGEDGPTVRGKVLYVGAVADSGTLAVRVEVPNSGLRPAGERVRVTFSPVASAGEAGKVSPATSPTSQTSQKKEQENG